MKCFPVLAFVLPFISCSPSQNGEVHTNVTSTNASTTICGVFQAVRVTEGLDTAVGEL